MEDHSEVTDAELNNYCGNIEITGKDDDHIIKIEVSFKEMEGK